MAEAERKKGAARERSARAKGATRKARGKEAPPEKATKARKDKEIPSLKAGHVHVYSVEGEIVRSVELPPVFHCEIRGDLIRRAVTAYQANRRQPYGPSSQAGMRHSVRWSGKGQGVSRVPRIRGTMTGAQAPGTVGGRRSAPPRVERIWSKKVNARERHLARNAALAALKEPSMVTGRGHRFREDVSLPVVVEDRLESMEPDGGFAREGLTILGRLGLMSDVDRAKKGRHVRAGRGKMRGRRYRQPQSLLVVVREADPVRRLFGNLPGVEVVRPASLNAEVLAPGGAPGRLTLFTEGALEALRSWPV